MNTSKEPFVRIWCHARGLWWRPNRNGYTGTLHEAGLYRFSEAVEICDEANRYSAQPEESIVPLLNPTST